MSLKTLLAALFIDSSYCADCLTSLPINSLPLITTIKTLSKLNLYRRMLTVKH